jgi:hypothetical protein
MSRFFLFYATATYAVFTLALAVSYYIAQREEWRAQRAFQPRCRPVLSRQVVDRSR